MFSGLGSLPDFSTSLSSFTNALSLDTLQQTTTTKTTDASKTAEPTIQSADSAPPVGKEAVSEAIQEPEPNIAIKSSEPATAPVVTCDGFAQKDVIVSEVSSPSVPAAVGDSNNEDNNDSIIESIRQEASQAAIQANVTIAQLTERTKDLEDECRSHETEKKRLQDELLALSQQSKLTAENQSKLATETATTVAQEQQSMQTRLSSLKQEKQELTRRLSAADEEKSRLSAQNTTLTDRLQKMLPRLQELKEMKEEVGQLRADRQRLVAMSEEGAEAVKLRLKLEKAQEIADEQTERANEAFNRAQAAQSALQLLQEDMSALSSARDTAQTQAISLAADKQALSDSLSSLQTRYDKLADDYRLLYSSSHAIGDQQLDLEQYKRRSTAALKALREETTSLQSSLAAAVEQLQKAKGLQGMAEETVASLTVELEEERSLSSRQRATILTLQQRIDELQASYDQAVLQIQRLQQLQQPGSHDNRAAMTEDMITVSSSDNDNDVDEDEADLHSNQRGAMNREQALSPATSHDTQHSQVQQVQGGANSSREAMMITPAHTVNVIAAATTPSSSSQQQAILAINSIASTEKRDSSSTGAGSTEGSGLMLVDELRQQVSLLKAELARRGLEMDDLLRRLSEERIEKETLRSRVEELTAFLNRLRQSHGPAASSNSHHNSSSSSSSIIPIAGDNQSSSGGGGMNIEYLKNCIFRFITAADVSERQRLVPVLAALLSFTPKERDRAIDCVGAEAAIVNSSNEAAAQLINDALSSVSSWFG